MSCSQRPSSCRGTNLTLVPPRPWRAGSDPCVRGCAHALLCVNTDELLGPRTVSKTSVVLLKAVACPSINIAAQNEGIHEVLIVLLGTGQRAAHKRGKPNAGARLSGRMMIGERYPKSLTTVRIASFFCRWNRAEGCLMSGGSGKQTSSALICPRVLLTAPVTRPAVYHTLMPRCRPSTDLLRHNARGSPSLGDRADSTLLRRIFIDRPSRHLRLHTSIRSRPTLSRIHVVPTPAESQCSICQESPTGKHQHTVTKLYGSCRARLISQHGTSSLAPTPRRNSPLAPNASRDETSKPSSIPIRADINNEELRAQLRTVQYELDSLKQERDLHELHHQQELREVQARAEADFKRAQAAESACQAAVKKADTLSHEYQELQDRIANERSALEKKVRNFQDEARSFKEDLEEARAELTSQERHNQHTSSELAQKSATLAAAVEELQQDLDSKVNALQSAQQKLKLRDAEVGELENEVLRLKAQNRRCGHSGP
ncbi:hypothetical protein MRB53_041324 [Persea americana]|nr:hypothetical protein MRB53_041324 [Persea americana]